MNPIEALHAILPWWAGWGQLVFWPPLLYAVSWIGAWIGAAFALRPLRTIGTEAWVERARVAHTARRILLLTAICTPALATLLALSSVSVLSLVPRWLTIALAVAASVSAVIRVGQRTESRLRDIPYSMREWWRTTVFHMFILRSGFLPVFVATILLMPRQLNGVAVAVAVGAMLVLLALSLGGSVYFLRMVGFIKPAPARALDVTAEAARRIGREPRFVYEFESQAANALAHPLQGWIGFTRGIFNGFNDEELTAVAAHELEHLAMPRRLLLIRLVTFYVWFLPLLFLKPVVATYGLNGACFFGGGFVLLTVAVGRFQRVLMAREEKRADAAGTRHEVDEGSYARALEKIYRRNLVPVTWQSPLGHAPLYDRMIAAGVEPEYPRPQPPSRFSLVACVLLQLAAYLALVMGLGVASRCADVLLVDRPQGQLVWLAFVGGREYDVMRLGHLRRDAGRVEEAIIFYRAASAMDIKSAWYPLTLSDALADAGRCAEAEAALEEAERRAEQYRQWRVMEQWIQESRDRVRRCRDAATDDDAPAKETKQAEADEPLP